MGWMKSGDRYFMFEGFDLRVCKVVMVIESFGVCKGDGIVFYL